MSRLRRGPGDRAAARNALTRRQPHAGLHMIDEQVERALGVGLDQLELWKRAFEGFNVIAILHFVQPICGIAISIATIAMRAATITTAVSAFAAVLMIEDLGLVGA